MTFQDGAYLAMSSVAGTLEALSLVTSGVVAGGAGGGTCPPSDNFLGALKSKGGAKIRNCQCEILYKIRKVQLFNKIKDSSNSGISR